MTGGAEARERLLDAMAAGVAAHGYAGVSVVGLVEQTDLQRGAFYEHFSNRADCFLAAYRSARKRIAGAVLAAAQGDDAGPEVALDALLEQVAADPDAAHLLLFEALGAPRRVREEHERLIATIEAEAERFLASQRPEDGELQIPAPALLTGIVDVVSIRLMRGEADSLPAARDQLLAWVESYRLPAGAIAETEWKALGAGFPPTPPAIAPEPSLLPRGRNALAPEVAAAQRRARIVEATTRLTAAKGYEAVTVAEIAKAARVTKAAFYSHFDSKQDAFLAVQRKGVQESLAASASAFYEPERWPERVWAGLRGLLRYLACNPASTYLGVVEVHCAGRAAMALEHDTRMAYTLFLEGGHREPYAISNPPPSICAEAITAANFGLLRRQVVSAGAERAMALLPQLAYVTLAPFLGPQGAMEFVRGRGGAAC